MAFSDTGKKIKRKYENTGLYISEYGGAELGYLVHLSMRDWPTCSEI